MVLLSAWVSNAVGEAVHSEESNVDATSNSDVECILAVPEDKEVDRDDCYQCRADQ